MTTLANRYELLNELMKDVAVAQTARDEYISANGYKTIDMNKDTATGIVLTMKAANLTTLTVGGYLVRKQEGVTTFMRLRNNLLIKLVGQPAMFQLLENGSMVDADDPSFISPSW